MPRPVWKGAISFGLVNVPVELFKATAPTSGHQISFHQVHKECGTRIKYKRWCPTDDREVPWDEIEKGYEFEKGRYAIVSNQELKGLPRPDEAAIAMEAFVAQEEIDPLYYDRGYYVSPDGAGKAYALLHQTLKDSGRVAVARMALRTRAHLALLRAVDGRLVLHTMFYPEEIVDASSVPAGSTARISERERQMARELVEHMAAHFEPEEYKDEYTARLREMLEKKISGEEVVQGPLLPTEGGKVVDLMDALRRSLGGTGRPAAAGAGKPARRHPASRRQAATRRHHKKAS